MIRATVLRALVLTAAFAAALTPVTCLGEDSKLTLVVRNSTYDTDNPMLFAIYKRACTVNEARRRDRLRRS